MYNIHVLARVLYARASTCVYARARPLLAKMRPGVLVEAIPFQSEWGWYVVLKGTKAYGEHSSPENQIITTTKTTSQRTTAEKWLKPLPQAHILGETDFQGQLTVDILVLQS